MNLLFNLLSFFEDDACMRFETSTFWQTKKRVGFRIFRFSRVSPPPKSPKSPGPGFVWVKNWTGVPCWTMLVVSWITGNESIQKDLWNLQTYGCCDVSLDWWMKSLGNAELSFGGKMGLETWNLFCLLFTDSLVYGFVCGSAIVDMYIYTAWWEF